MTDAGYHHDVIAECQRLLVEAGRDDELSGDLESLSAGAVRSSALLSVSGNAGNPSSKPVKLVAQISNRQDEEVVEPTPLSRIPVDLEQQAISAASGANVPVAPLVAAGSSDVLNADVLITGWVAGESIPRRVLRSCASGAWGRELAEQCGRALAAIHSVGESSVDDLPRLAGSEPYRRHIEQLGATLDDLGAPNPALRYGMWWLVENRPAAVPDLALVHGDFRLGNLLIEDGTLNAVVDWELSHLGDPMCDLAWLCLRTWRFGADELEVGGFGRLSDLKRAYRQAGGLWNEHRFAWWSVARSVWWGIGLASQAKAFVGQRAAGAPTTIVHAASGRRVVELEYDLLNLIGDLDGL